LNYLKNKIEKLTSKKYKLDRNYMHIQTFGQDGGYHYDTLEKDCYSFCLYITNINNNKIDNSNGELFIKIPGEKHILSIDTYMNRGVFFPSNYLHKGMAYNRYIKDKRLCITWKLKEII
jgi:Rps23 Pro-64 3,4-dihydroxylase Tpa1-like proline 4-hydroxylase